MNLIALVLTHVALAAAPGDVSLNPLYTQSNDRDRNIDTYNLMVDRNGLAAGFYTRNGDGSEGTFWMKDIAKPEGVVLVEAQGHKVLLLQGDVDRATQEGRFHVKFLANGLTNKYDTCDFLLKKNGNAWFAQNAYTGQKVTTVKILTHALGLKTLQGLCQN